MRELTEAQRSVLAWLPANGDSASWAGKPFRCPPKAAVNACLRRDWAKRVGHPNMDLYAITDAGRTALNPPTREGEGGQP